MSEASFLPQARLSGCPGCLAWVEGREVLWLTCATIPGRQGEITDNVHYAWSALPEDSSHQLQNGV